MEWAKYKALQAENAELKREIEFLGEVSAFFRRSRANDYFMFISAEKATFPINWMCHKLKVSRDSFYRWLRPAEPTKTQVRHDALDAHVVGVYEREKSKAGRDQITTLLSQEGVSIATGTVGSIMAGRGLRA